MTRAAILRVRTPSGRLATFEADHADVDHGIVTATGRWRDDRAKRTRTYSWGQGQVVEIRWTREAVTT
jgi:hypothetical protein